MRGICAAQSAERMNSPLDGLRPGVRLRGHGHRVKAMRIQTGPAAVRRRRPTPGERCRFVRHPAANSFARRCGLHDYLRELACPPPSPIIITCCGAVAHLVERYNRTVEVRGSSPLCSTGVRSPRPEPDAGFLLARARRRATRRAARSSYHPKVITAAWCRATARHCQQDRS